MAAAALTIAVAKPTEGQHTVRTTAGRFTVESDSADLTLARSLLAEAVRTDTFPGLPRPTEPTTIVIARNGAHFRRLIGPSVPEWGSAVAFPAANRIIMQGRRAGSRAGDPLEVLRHELAHLAVHESVGDLAPRWFDEGYASYAASEWSREDALRANLALAIRGAPTFAELERWFVGGATRAEAAYALGYRAVAELAALDSERGLSVFFSEWQRTRRLDAAIRNAYGMTLDGFEAHWRKRTRRRYGGLAMLADVTLASLLVFLLVFPLYVARRRRDRRRMAALVAADAAAEQAARESALRAFLAIDTANGSHPNGISDRSPDAGTTR